MIYKGQLVKQTYCRPKKIGVVIGYVDKDRIAIQWLTARNTLNTYLNYLVPAKRYNLLRFIKTEYYGWAKQVPDNLRLMNIEQHLREDVWPVIPGSPSTSKGGNKMK